MDQMTDQPHRGQYRTFEDLDVYKAAREFRKAMYSLTRRLPVIERYELASQVRRAAVSLTNNIAEGHGRYHYLEQIKFSLQARGSLEELLDDLNICEDEHYLPGIELTGLKEQAWSAHRLLNGYIRWLRERKQAESLELREFPPAYGIVEDELDAIFGAEPAQPPSTLQPFNPSTPTK